MSDWIKSSMYRRGYAEGRARGQEEAKWQPPIVVHMADGQVLHCQDVIDELRRAGWCLHPIERSPMLRVVKS